MTRTPSGNTPSSHIDSEASAWFVSFRFDDVDAAARQRFNEWLRRSPEHIQAYLDIAGTWARLPSADPAGRIDVDELIARARAPAADVISLSARVESHETEGGSVVVRAAQARWRRPRILLAASIVVCCLVLGAVASVVLDRDRTYTTDVGDPRSIALPDGSSVELNSRTRINVRFTRHERYVELVEGQALFSVAKDSARPFVVNSGGTRVRAVGTQFDVYRKDSATIVTVVEGRVAILSAAAGTAQEVEAGSAVSVGSKAADARPEILYLTAGEQVAVDAESPELPGPTQTDVNAATSWVRKKIVFDATPLAEVVKEFNRYSRRSIRVEDEDLGALGISGIYTSTDPTSLLRFLRAQPGVRIIETDQEIRITREPSR